MGTQPPFHPICLHAHPTVLKPFGVGEGYGFRRIRCFLWEDFNPFWSIECQHHFPVKNIDDGHDDVAIDDDSFALGTNESLHDSGPPNIALLGN